MSKPEDQSATPESMPAKDQREIPPPGQYVLIAGAIIGIVLGSMLVFVSPVKGAIPGAFFGIGGAVAGAFIARPIAIAVNKRTK